MKYNDEEIDKQFRNLMESMTDDVFWEWVRKWYNEDTILDICNNWEIEEKIETLKEFGYLQDLKD